MSCPPYFNENSYAHPPLYTRPWFLRDCSHYEPVPYSVVPFYFHPRVYLATPEVYRHKIIDPSNPFMVVPFLPVPFNHHQRESSYCSCATAEMNACRLEVLEKPNTVHSNSGEKAIIKSHQLSSDSSEKSRFSKPVVNLIDSSGHSDSRSMEQRESGVLNAHHEPELSEKSEINISSEFQAGTNCSISSQSGSVSAFQLKSSKENITNFSSKLAEELESACKQQKFSIALEDASETDIINLDTDAYFPHFRDNQNDENKCNDLDDDSQLEYHSAEEQDYIGHNSYRQETETSETFQDKELTNEDDQQPFNKLDDESSTSGCSIVGDCYSEIPEFSQMFHDGKCTEGECSNCDDQEKDETISMFYSIVNEDSFSTSKKRNNSKSFPLGKSGIDEKVKVNSLTNITLTSLMATNKGLCKKIDYNSARVFQKTGNPHVLQQERTLSHIHLSNGDSEVSNSCVHEQSVVLNANKNCTYKDRRCQDNFPNSKLKNVTYLNNVASNHQSKVNQAVDASSDFRACFTTSRATNVKASVVSRAQNTVITMMSKRRPKEWLADSHRSVACNTDWSCISGSMEITDSQIVMANTLGNCIGSDTAKHGWTSNFETNTMENLLPLPFETPIRPKICSRRPLNPPEQIVEAVGQRGNSLTEVFNKQRETNAILLSVRRYTIITSVVRMKGYVVGMIAVWKPVSVGYIQCHDPLELENSISTELNEIPNRMMQLSQEITERLPNCCKEILQRAIKAEMQLLKIRYQMYHQHCWQTSKSIMEEKEHVKSSSLGIGKSVSQVSLPQNTEASLPLVTPQMSENFDHQLWPSNKMSKERKNDLVENSSSNTQEISEDWFDATENLTVTDSSRSLTDQSKLIVRTETKTIEDRKRESKNIYLVHVGGLSPLVSEIDLWLHFQNYNVSEISICEYSDNYRYASLSFKTASDAKMAVKEKNQRKIKGKEVKVRLVKVVRENGVRDHQSLVKQEHENERPNNNSNKDIEYRKNCNVISEVPPSASATPKVPAGGPISSSNISGVSKGSIKSSLPNGRRPPSATSKELLCVSAPSKVLNPDFKSSSSNTCFEIDQEDIAEGLLPLASVQFTPNPSTTFIPPNTLNLRSFRKIVKKLEELHPEVSRDNILDALVEIKENKGLLSGLPLSIIVEMTSSLLNKKMACQSKENQENNLRTKQVNT
ncbi:RNA-binding protein 44 [Elgaria multicarinata webbii]|uniref:RNA-binding protein 44 n=1 Tax=Elgaria multicarinata webbii TaxID=159646 RepID=UPI002FCD6B21